MRSIFFFTIICICSVSCCFAQDRLRYFISSDSSKVGVKDEKGTVVLPCLFDNIFEHDTSKFIGEPTILLYRNRYPDKNFDKQNPAIGFGEVYSRKGKFLYRPFLFDNGADYWEEGIRRFVEEGKFGYADKLGNKLTEAKYGFAETFNYGYAKAYRGAMVKKYEKGGEHWTAVPATDDVTSVLVNSAGKEIAGSESPKDQKDYFFEGKYYPNPFIYSQKEQGYIDLIKPWEKIVSILFEISYYQREYTLLQFEITERPNSFYPYYVISAFDKQEQLTDRKILIHENSKEIFLSTGFHEDDFKPIKPTVIEELATELRREKDYFGKGMFDLATQELEKMKAIR